MTKLGIEEMRKEQIRKAWEHFKRDNIPEKLNIDLTTINEIELCITHYLPANFIKLDVLYQIMENIIDCLSNSSEISDSLKYFSEFSALLNKYRQEFKHK